MKFLKLIFVFMLFLSYVQSYSNSEYCAEPYHAKTSHVFTIGDKILIRTVDNNLWIYDQKLQEVEEKPINVIEMFAGTFEVIQFMVAITSLNCGTNCDSDMNKKVIGLVIVIGSNRTYNGLKVTGYATFRLQENRSLVRITDINELPQDWGLNPSGSFSLGTKYGKFWPTSVLDIQDFTYYSPIRMILLRTTHDYNQQQFVYKIIENSGKLPSQWTVRPHLHKVDGQSTFEMDGWLYTILNVQIKETKNKFIVQKFKFIQDSNQDFTLQVYEAFEGKDDRTFFKCFSTTNSTQSAEPTEPSLSPSEITEISSQTEGSVRKEDTTETSSAALIVIIVVLVFMIAGIILVIVYFMFIKKKGDARMISDGPSNTLNASVKTSSKTSDNSILLPSSISEVDTMRSNN